MSFTKYTPSLSQKSCRRLSVSVCLYSVLSARSSPRLLFRNSAIACSTVLASAGAGPRPSFASRYGPRVIAVLLSGLYDDGVQGLQVVGQRGGKVIVLKPVDAPFPQMPENAIKYDHPDYILSANAIFPQIRELVASFQSSAEMAINNEVDEHYESASGYICPDCGGPLFENGDPHFPHFRCRIGHAYSLNALLAGGDDALETALWAAVRALQENAELKERTATMLERSGKSFDTVRIREDAKAQMEQAKLLRERIVEVQKRL